MRPQTVITTTTEVKVARKSIGDAGVFSCRSFELGEFIGFFEGYEIDHRTRYSVQINGCHIEPIGSFRYLNHSCDPNAFFESRNLIALKRIKPGEEITINYKNTEGKLAYPFQCYCRSPNCLGWIE